jgi:hypothetical protein
VSRASERQLACVFGTAAITCYYWYRLPALFGYGLFPDDGVLLNLHGTPPEWWVPVARLLATGLFVWWLVLRKAPARHWLDRPEFALRRPQAIPLSVCQEQPADVPA